MGKPETSSVTTSRSARGVGPPRVKSWQPFGGIWEAIVVRALFGQMSERWQNWAATMVSSERTFCLTLI